MSDDPHVSVYDDLLTTDELAGLADTLDRDRTELNIATVVWTDGVELPLLFQADGAVSDVDVQLVAADRWSGGVEPDANK